jgi:hypothetical protein
MPPPNEVFGARLSDRSGRFLTSEPVQKITETVVKRSDPHAAGTQRRSARPRLAHLSSRGEEPPPCCATIPDRPFSRIMECIGRFFGTHRLEVHGQWSAPGQKGQPSLWICPGAGPDW